MQRLSDLPRTQSGTVQKDDAMEWLKELTTDDSEQQAEETAQSITIKPYEFEGSTHATQISNLRFTGSEAFITQMAKQFAHWIHFETAQTRLQINLQKLKNRETEEFTEAWALYLSVSERGREAKMARTMMEGLTA